MASPNCCGGVALILSGLKANNLPYSPHSIRRSLENTALAPKDSDPHSVGHGLLQVDKAYTHASKFATSPHLHINFEVTIPEQGATNRGIYLREPPEIAQVIQRTVKVRPVWPELEDQGEQNPAKVAFEVKTALVATQPWIHTPDHMILMHGGRTFTMRVDPTHLPPGVHFGEIHGFDVDHPTLGPIFRVPVTVIKPTPLTREKGSVATTERGGNGGVSAHGAGSHGGEDVEPTVFVQEHVRLLPGEIRRHFLHVPVGATWLDLTLTGHNYDRPRTYVIHTVQRVPQRAFKDHEHYHTVALGQDRSEKSLSVLGGVTLELVVAQYWSSLGPSEVSIEAVFHGLVAQPRDLFLSGGDWVTQVSLAAPLRPEEAHPQLSLEVLRRSVRPSESQIRPLSERDVLVNGRQSYELCLVYNFKFPECAAEVSPRAPVLLDLLYENPYEAQFWMLFDSNRRHLASGDVFEEKVKLSKGAYTLRFQVRHDSLEMLERLQDMVIQLDFKLKDKVTLTAFPDLTSSRTEKGKMDSRKLARGETCGLFVTGVAKDKLPKDSAPGDLLVGTVKYEKKTKGHPLSYPSPFSHCWEQGLDREWEWRQRQGRGGRQGGQAGGNGGAEGAEGAAAQEVQGPGKGGL